MAKAVERYNRAMLSDEQRDKFIIDYLPLVKSLVLRMKHNFPTTVWLKTCMELELGL